MRMTVKLRAQNTNDAPVDYKGVAVEMDVQGKTFATGVTNAAGTVPGFGEAVIAVPVTTSALRMARQALGMMSSGGIQKIEYEMKGKLSSGGMSATRFVTKGQFDLQRRRRKRSTEALRPRSPPHFHVHPGGRDRQSHPRNPFLQPGR